MTVGVNEILLSTALTVLLIRAWKPASRLGNNVFTLSEHGLSSDGVPVALLTMTLESVDLHVRQR